MDTSPLSSDREACPDGEESGILYLSVPEAQACRSYLKPPTVVVVYKTVPLLYIILLSSMWKQIVAVPQLRFWPLLFSILCVLY